MTRYFVAGSEPSKWNLFDSGQWTRDAAEPFDRVCLLPGANAARLGRLLAEQRRLLVPVINLTGRRWQRADFHAERPSVAALRDAVEQLSPLDERLQAVHIADSPDYPSLAILALAQTRNVEIVAERAPQQPQLVRYPLLAGIAQPRRLLEDLAGQGLLQRRHFDRFYFCGHCSSSRLHVREECSSCRSSDLHDVSLVHHYRCGYQGEETGFRQQDSLQCPKCHKELRHYGVDYDKPATVHRCGACSELSDEPAIGFVCNDCGRHADAGSLETRDWYHYSLTPGGAAALAAGVLPQNSVRALLGKKVGICSTREFALTATQLLRIAERFQRPLSACSIHIRNFDELRGEFGVSNLASGFLLLGEIIAQVLRNTDLVSVHGQNIYLLLAETDSDKLRIVEQRLRDETARRIALPMDFEIRHYGVDALADMLRQLD